MSMTCSSIVMALAPQDRKAGSTAFFIVIIVTVLPVHRVPFSFSAPPLFASSACLGLEASLLSVFLSDADTRPIPIRIHFE